VGTVGVAAGCTTRCEGFARPWVTGVVRAGAGGETVAVERVGGTAEPDGACERVSMNNAMPSAATPSTTATSYCIQSPYQGGGYYKAGPAAAIVAGSCP